MKTLREIDTLGDLIDYVEAHLVKQGIRAWASTACAYRGADGTSCAVGCLITDEHYAPGLEGSSVDSEAGGPAILAAVEASLGRKLSHDVRHVLRGLQHIHDLHAIEAWPDSVAVLRERHAAILGDRIDGDTAS